MRGGVARWKRGQQSHGVKQAVNYAFSGVCDATLTAKTADGVIAASGYADAVMTRYIVENGNIREDLLTRDQLKGWVDGLDPLTAERRGRDLESPVADLILDATINAPKSFSIAAMLDPEFPHEMTALSELFTNSLKDYGPGQVNKKVQGALANSSARYFRVTIEAGFVLDQEAWKQDGVDKRERVHLPNMLNLVETYR